MTDFDPQYVKQPDVYAWQDDRVKAVFHPAEGNAIALVYIELTPGNAAAINALLSQIDALAAQQAKKIWPAASAVVTSITSAPLAPVASAEDGRRPEFIVRARARTNAAL